MNKLKALILALATLFSAPSFGANWATWLCSALVSSGAGENQQKVEALLREQDLRQPRYKTIKMDSDYDNETQATSMDGPVYYLSEQEREAYRIVEIDGFVYSANGDLVCGGRECSGIFWSDARGRTYFLETFEKYEHMPVLFRKADGTLTAKKPLLGKVEILMLRHSSLGRAEDGIAGTMKFAAGGKLQTLKNDSGHYKSRPEEFLQVLKEFSRPEVISFHVESESWMVKLFFELRFDNSKDEVNRKWILEYEKQWVSTPNLLRPWRFDYQRHESHVAKAIAAPLLIQPKLKDLALPGKLILMKRLLQNPRASVSDIKLQVMMGSEPEKYVGALMVKKESFLNSFSPKDPLIRFETRIFNALGVRHSGPTDLRDPFVFELLKTTDRQFMKKYGVVKAAMDEADRLLRINPDDQDLWRLYDQLVQFDSEDLSEQGGNRVNRLLDPPR